MTCQDCIQYDFCAGCGFAAEDETASRCKYFKNKADFQEVKHGEWTPKDVRYREPFARNYICSICGENPIGISNYCPNCGARMVGGGVIDEVN